MSGEWHKTSLKISEHCFGELLGVARQGAITSTNVDPELCHHMASLDHNELRIIKNKITSNLEISSHKLSFYDHTEISKAVDWTHSWLNVEACYGSTSLWLGLILGPHYKIRTVNWILHHQSVHVARMVITGIGMDLLQTPFFIHSYTLPCYDV